MLLRYLRHLDHFSGELAPITTVDEPGTPVTVHALAHDLGNFEEHIEKYGSVVAKAPNVWGQARLTKYRDEYEKLLAKEANNFSVGIENELENISAIESFAVTPVKFLNRTAVVVTHEFQAPLAALLKELVPEGKTVIIHLRGILSPAAEFKDVILVDNVVRVSVTRPKPK